MLFKNLCVLVFCMRVDLALEGLTCAFTECSLRASNRAINSSVLVALPHIFQRFSSLWLYHIGTPYMSNPAYAIVDFLGDNVSSSNIINGCLRHLVAAQVVMGA